MQRELGAYLSDILSAIDNIETFAGGLSLEAYESTLLVQSAVERQYEIIGEALRQADYHFPGALDSLPGWKHAIAFRNRLAHGYFNIDPLIAWEAMTNELPGLRLAVQDLFKKQPDLP